MLFFCVSAADTCRLLAFRHFASSDQCPWGAAVSLCVYNDMLMVLAPKINHLAPQGRPKTPKKRIRDATLNFLSIFINLCEQFSLYFNVFGTLQLILSACVNVFVLLRIDWLWPFIALSAMLAQWILTVFASIIQVCRIALSEGLAAFSIVAFCTKWTAIPSMISVLRHRSRVLSGLGACSG